MDLHKSPEHLLDALRERGHTDRQIEQMSPPKAFSEYCEWHGLIGWGGTLYSLAVDCHAQVK